MINEYIPLNNSQIEQLTQNGCSADDWNGVLATADFDAARVSNSSFYGVVKLGSNSGYVTTDDGINRRCGVYNATIANTTIGNNVLISSVRGAISSYDIEDGAVIIDTGSIVCKSGSFFGNGTIVNAVNEAGGREVAIFNGLTAQIAYIVAMYRDKNGVVDAFSSLVSSYCNSVKSSRGKIGKCATIVGCGRIEGVNIGEYATLQGALKLNNGSVNSSLDAKTFIGDGVNCSDFIVSEGAKVDNCTSLERCFVGEAATINHNFSAVDSLIFANSDLANGEGCSLFAAPYTVSHHKSTLLIAGFFSFFNAGSGTNQSNHLFKAGPVHQGVHERGCKFASNGYVALPCREGAFSVVLGRHYHHHDTQNFPYSYLVEKKGESFLIMGANLKSYGTERDLGKWEKRDKRVFKERDLINFERYSPYVGQKLINGIEIAQKLVLEGRDFYEYNGFRVSHKHLVEGIRLYKLELLATLADILAKGGDKLHKPIKLDKWCDVAGMYVPYAALNMILKDMSNFKYCSIDAVCKEMVALYREYDNFAYNWAVEVAESLGYTPSNFDKAIEDGTKAKEQIESLRDKDKLKDQNHLMMISYGVDSQCDEDILADFRSVRGID